MQRIRAAKRKNLADRAAETGFALLEIDGEPYWDETAYYGFTLQQIERDLEDPTAELAALCHELVSRAVGDERILKRLQIPEIGWAIIADSWRRGDASLYGRFDLAYDGKGPAKLLEYNADTPTALFEASVFQWLWLEDVKAAGTLAEADQFNSIHETLIARLQEFRKAKNAPKMLHLSCDPASAEDAGLIDYLADCAVQAGFETYELGLADIGNNNKGAFVDLHDNPIELLFKLYPWEWIFTDPFCKSPSMCETRFIEPAWKAILSNKGLLPLLWELAPGHPNLLPACFEDDAAACAKLGNSYARKPIHSREGQNIFLIRDGAVVDSETGSYGAAGYVRQSLASMPCVDGNYPVIGSWVVGDKACGIGIREDRSPITKNTSRFVPHAILP